MSNFKKINNFDYEINELGIVRNIITGNIIKPRLNKSGYLRVNLRINNKQYTRQIHRLLAEIFIANPEKKPTVDHIDRNKTNNNLDNLRWATYSENSKNRDNKTFEKLKMLKDNSEKRKIPVKILEYNIIFNSYIECSKYIKERLNLKGNINSISRYITSKKYEKKYNLTIISYQKSEVV